MMTRDNRTFKRHSPFARRLGPSVLLSPFVTDEDPREEPLVRRRPRRRVEISVDPEPGEALVPTAEPAVELRSGALLYGAERIPLPRAGLTVGSAEDAGLRLDDDGVAPRHAWIESTEAGHVLVDLGSDGGTFVNGERLIGGERRPLERGDSIAIGSSAIVHYVPSGDVPRKLAPIEPVDVGTIHARAGAFTIGRDAGSDLVLDHPTVSRRHARIAVERGTTWIEDLGSSTGVRVNGIPLRRTSLEIGDQIAIGPYRIVFDGRELIGRSAARGLPVTALGVSVAAGDNVILRPTELHLRPGELVAIIGESGAGKSTLLKTLAGVVRPTTGRVLVGGEPLEARLTEIGYVPQFDIVHGELTVREALDYSARLRLPIDFDEAERVRRIQDVIDELQLTDRADLRVAVLSGGQRKRAAVGTELLHQPGVLFLDEPTTGLDPGLERLLMEFFRKLATSGQTVAIVTHATQSIRLCDRVIVMARGGVVCFDGRPDELLEAFGVDSVDEVYVALAEARAPRSVAEQSSGARPPLPPLPAPRAARATRDPFLHQTQVLTSRYATLLRRDRRHLRSALVQVPILGLLTAFLFSSHVFAHGPSFHTAKSAQLLFLMVTVALWLGAINAAREVVKERNVLVREVAVGVRLSAYITSKLVVLFGLAAAQTLLFSFIVLTFRPLHEPRAAALKLAAILVLASTLAILLGLLVSGHAETEDQATSIIPLVLVPQLLLGGAIVPLKEMPTPMRLLADLIPARWGFAASGRSIHLQERIAADPEFSRTNNYGAHFFTITFGTYLFVFLLFAAVFVSALAYLLRKSTSGETATG
jgi:ABC transport system ATP-binding/permease protein